jgi:SpoVK/Ycf46/Vps4 family AAA+-type ATPase
VSVDSFSLTRTFFEQVLPEYEYLCNQRFASRDEKKLESNMGIAPKQLYYNPREESELKQLEQLLQPNVFQQVQQRLAESGFRSGFACLFYGVAGCGKTETVLQLARSTNRSILRINPNDIQDKFVGESEKNLKNAFDRYRRMVNDAHANDEPCPILLFNEADAVFSRRLDKISSSVDQMQNSLQNILLQEMETLPGILIATTNLSENFDSAFERRFIYKILFEKPSPEVASHIWQTMLPNLTANEALQLAEEYQFTGGQIENIARKQQVEYILTGKQSSMADLQGYCKQEFLHNAHTSRKMIGFAAGN